jgi:hypothetical protein
VIDGGRPLTDDLAHRLATAPEAVRHFRGVAARRIAMPLPRLETDHVMTLATAASLLTVLPSQRRPRTRDAWVELMHTALYLAPLHACLRRCGPTAAEAFREGSLRRFMRLSHERRMRVLLPLERPVRRPRMGLEGVGDAVDALERFMAERRIDRAQLAPALAYLPLLEWVRFNEAWHEAITEFDTVGHALDPHGRFAWPALLPECDIGDLRIVALTSVEALRDEGRALRHCVGAYVQRCLFDRTHIFSLRSAAGERLATIQVDAISGQDGTFGVQLVQQRGPSNRTPAEACVHAVQRLMPVLERLPQTHFQALEKARLERRARRADLQDAMDGPRDAYAMARALPGCLLAVLGPSGTDPARTLLGPARAA